MDAAFCNSPPGELVAILKFGNIGMVDTLSLFSEEVRRDVV